MSYPQKQGRSIAIFLLFSLALLSVTSIYVTQPIVTMIESHFGVSAQLSSFAFTSASLGYSVALLFYSALAVKVGLKKVIVVASLFLGLISLFIAPTTSYAMFLGLRFLQGVFAAGIPAIGMAYIHTVLARPHRVHGIFVSGLLSGALLSRVFGGVFAYYIGIPPLFYILAVSSFAISTLSFALLKNDTPNGKFENPFNIFQELKNPITYYGCLSSFCFFGAFTAIYNIAGFQLANTFSLNSAQIGLLFLCGCTGPITSFFSSRIFGTLSSLNLVFLGYALAIVAIAIFAVPSLIAIGIALMVFNCAIFGIHAILSNITAQLSWNKSRGTSLYMIFYYTGGTLGAASSGFAYAQGGWSMTLFVSFVFLILGGIANFGLVHHRSKNAD